MSDDTARARTPRPDRRSRAAHRRRAGVDVPRGTASSSAASSTASRSSTRKTRWPVEGTKAEKRAERSVAYWLLLGGFSGLALLLVFLFWPWEYKPYGAEGELRLRLATPLYGADLRPVDPGDRHRRGAVPEEVHPRRDLHPGPPRRSLPRDSSARPSRPTSPTRLEGSTHQAAQADRAVARHRPRRVRCSARWWRSSAA